MKEQQEQVPFAWGEFMLGFASAVGVGYVLIIAGMSYLAASVGEQAADRVDLGAKCAQVVSREG